MAVPHWINIGKATEHERRAWQTYVCSVVAHEALHLEIARRAARRALRRLALVRAASKQELIARYNQMWAYASTWARAEDERLDRHTCHGPSL